MGLIWRVLIDEAEDGAWNMAMDEAILDAVTANAAPPTVRLYQWKRPTVTVGRFQNVARTIDRDACARHGIPLIRRITGGRGILHGDDLTISLIAPVEVLGFDGGASVSTLALYRRIAQGFLNAFACVGIAAAPGVCSQLRTSSVQGDCFATASQADIVEAGSGRKLMGAALHRRDCFLIEQVSVPFHIAPTLCEGEGQTKTIPSPYEGEGRGGVAAVFCGKNAAPRGETGYGIGVDSLSEWREILIAELMRHLGAACAGGMVSEAESVRANELIRLRYGSEVWTETGVRLPTGHEIDRAVRL